MSVERQNDDDEEFKLHGVDAKGDVDDDDDDERNGGNEEDDDDMSDGDEDEEEDATNRGRWSMAEDEQLRMAIGAYTNHKYNWHAISLLVPGR
jgi:hypothetical protein